MPGIDFVTTNNVPPGGKAGQVLKKATDDSYEVYWADEEGDGGGLPGDATPIKPSDIDKLFE